MNEKIYLICYETVADFLELVKTAVNERVKEKFIITNIINLTKIRKELEE